MPDAYLSYSLLSAELCTLALQNSLVSLAGIPYCQFLARVHIGITWRLDDSWASPQTLRKNFWKRSRKLICLTLQDDSDVGGLWSFFFFFKQHLKKRLFQSKFLYSPSFFFSYQNETYCAELNQPPRKHTLFNIYKSIELSIVKFCTTRWVTHKGRIT